MGTLRRVAQRASNTLVLLPVQKQLLRANFESSQVLVGRHFDFDSLSQARCNLVAVQLRPLLPFECRCGWYTRQAAALLALWREEVLNESRVLSGMMFGFVVISAGFADGSLRTEFRMRSCLSTQERSSFPKKILPFFSVSSIFATRLLLTKSSVLQFSSSQTGVLFPVPSGHALLHRCAGGAAGVAPGHAALRWRLNAIGKTLITV